MIRCVHSVSRIQVPKKHRILNPDPQHWESEKEVWPNFMYTVLNVVA
jgi:hypothetical protein